MSKYFTRNDSKVKEPTGRVYLFKIYLDYGCNDVVYKIGITTRDRSDDRFIEVLSGFFKQFRYIPRCVMLRDRPHTNHLAKEKELHERFKEGNVKFNKKFGGSTEFFADIDEEELLESFNW